MPSNCNFTFHTEPSILSGCEFALKLQAGGRRGPAASLRKKLLNICESTALVSLSCTEASLLADAVFEMLALPDDELRARAGSWKGSPVAQVIKARGKMAHLGGALGDYNATQFRSLLSKPDAPAPDTQPTAEQVEERALKAKRDEVFGKMVDQVNIWGEVVEPPATQQTKIHRSKAMTENFRLAYGGSCNDLRAQAKSANFSGGKSYLEGPGGPVDVPDEECERMSQAMGKTMQWRSSERVFMSGATIRHRFSSPAQGERFEVSDPEGDGTSPDIEVLRSQGIL